MQVARGLWRTHGTDCFTPVDADELEKIFLQMQRQIRGPAPPQELIVLDGKEPRRQVAFRIDVGRL